MSYFTIDSILIEQVNSLSNVEEKSQLMLFELSMQLLEGKDVSESIKSLSEQLGVNGTNLAKICSSASSLLWECTNFNLRDQGALLEILVQLGLGGVISGSFCKIFHSSRRRILLLKGLLAVNSLSYRNLSWRLDVELAKRNMTTPSNPMYLLRLDLSSNNNFSSADRNHSHGSSHLQSLHLQADYANMKLLETELQRALNEVNSVHCQRINRYIS